MSLADAVVVIAEDMEKEAADLKGSEPSGFLAMGTVSIWALSRGRRSPCQPLMTVTWPSS